eukprot:1599120-Pyramimonas_sp.AAC.1
MQSIYAVQPMRCNLCGAFINAQFEIGHSTARANIPPTHPQLGLQTPCGNDCDECLVLAGASLRPR